MSKLRAIPQLPSGLDARTQQFLAALKENIEILGGQRGESLGATTTTTTVETTSGGGNGPAFSAYQSSSQSIPAQTATKINFQSEIFDTAACFDPSTSRFTPNVAGYYLFTLGVQASNASGLFLYFKRSGAQMFASSAAGAYYAVSYVMAMNGTTDYAEAFIYTNSAAGLMALPEWTYFQGVMLRAA